MSRAASTRNRSLSHLFSGERGDKPIYNVGAAETVENDWAELLDSLHLCGMCQLINSAVLICLAVGIAWEVKPSCVLGVSGTFCMLVPNVVLLVSLRQLLLAAVLRCCGLFLMH